MCFAMVFFNRDVMTQLTLGPLAFKYPKNMLVYIPFNFLLEIEFVADQLKFSCRT